MANRQNGEVSIDVGGERFTLVLTIDAMVALEELFSTSAQVVTFQQVAEWAERGSVKHLRALLWAVLQKYHPTIEIKDVSDFVQRAGGLGVLTVKMMELAKSVQADPKDLAALGIPAEANPPQAQAAKATRGNGGRSTSAPAGKA